MRFEFVEPMGQESDVIKVCNNSISFVAWKNDKNHVLDSLIKYWENFSTTYWFANGYAAALIEYRDRRSKTADRWQARKISREISHINTKQSKRKI